MKNAAVAGGVTVAAPSIGPAIVTVFGLDIPILPAVLAIAGLLLARMIAKPPQRKLSTMQEAAVTILLAIFLILLVSGSFGLDPVGEGPAFGWGVGIGLSGLTFLELFGDRFLRYAKHVLNAIFPPPPSTPK